MNNLNRREQFAITVLTQLIEKSFERYPENVGDMSATAIKFADALIAELEKYPQLHCGDKACTVCDGVLK